MKLADILPEKEIKEAVLGEYEKRLFCINLRTSSLRRNTR